MVNFRVVLCLLTIVFVAINGSGFPSFMDKMSASARVLTGIALSNGLADKSIPLDGAIAEMLNIQGVGMAEVGKFDASAIEGFLGKLKTSSGQLGGVSPMEKGLSACNMIGNQWNALKSGLGALPKDITPLNALKSVDPSVLHDLGSADPEKIRNAVKLLEKSSIHHGKSFVSQLEPMISLADLVKFTDDTHLGGSHVASQSHNVSSHNVSTTTMSLPTATTSAPTTTMTLPTTTISISPADRKKVDNMVNIVQTLSSSSSSVPMNVVKAVAGSFRPNPSRNYTAGFPNGAADFNRTFTDILNPFIVQMFKPLNLKEAFEKLQPISSKLLQVKNTWKSLDAVLPSALRIDELQNTLKKATGVPVDKVMNFFSSCSSSKPPKGKFPGKMREVADNIENLKTKTNALQSAMDLVNSAVDGKMPDLSPYVKMLQNCKSIDSSIDELLSNPDLVTDLPNIPDFSPYKNFFQNMGTPSPGIPDLLKVPDMLRSLVPDGVLPSIGGALPTIAGALPMLNDIRGASFPSSNGFGNMKGVAEAANGFGNAVKTVSDIGKTLQKRSAVEKLVENGPLVSKEIRSGSQEGKLEELSRWSKFEEEGQKVARLMNKMEAVTSKMGSSPGEGASFADFAPLFSTIKGMDDVDLDVEDKLVSIDKMGKSSALMADVRDSLMDIAGIDLHFPHLSSIPGIPDVLKNIDQIMERKRLETTTEGDDYEMMIMIIAGVGIGVCLLISIIIAIILIKKHASGKGGGRKKARGESTDSSEDSPSDSN